MFYSQNEVKYKQVVCRSFRAEDKNNFFISFLTPVSASIEPVRRWSVNTPCYGAIVGGRPALSRPCLLSRPVQCRTAVSAARSCQAVQWSGLTLQWLCSAVLFYTLQITVYVSRPEILCCVSSRRAIRSHCGAQSAAAVLQVVLSAGAVNFISDKQIAVTFFWLCKIVLFLVKSIRINWFLKYWYSLQIFIIKWIVFFIRIVWWFSISDTHSMKLILFDRLAIGFQQIWSTYYSAKQ